MLCVAENQYHKTTRLKGHVNLRVGASHSKLPLCQVW